MNKFYDKSLFGHDLNRHSSMLYSVLPGLVSMTGGLTTCALKYLYLARWQKLLGCQQFHSIEGVVLVTKTIRQMALADGARLQNCVRQVALDSDSVLSREAGARREFDILVPNLKSRNATEWKVLRAVQTVCGVVMWSDRVHNVS